MDILHGIQHICAMRISLVYRTRGELTNRKNGERCGH